MKDFLGEEKWQELQKGYEQDARQILIGKKKEGAMIREALADFAQSAQKDLKDAEFTMDEIVVTRGNVVDEIRSEA